MPRWLLVAVLLCLGAVGGGLGVLLVSGDDRRSDQTSAVEGSTTTVTSSTTSTRTPVMPSTTTESTATVPITTSAPSTTPPSMTTLPAARGSLRVVDFHSGPSQPPQCRQWELLLSNNSNVEIVELNFAYEQYRYATLDDYDPQTQRYPPDQPAEYPGPTTQPVSIPPYGEQVVSTMTCTPTPTPTNADGYQLSTGRPIITYRWAEGSSGTIRF